MNIRSIRSEKAGENPKYMGDGWMMDDGLMDWAGFG